MQFAIIVPGILNWIMFLLGAVSFAALILICYRLFVAPALRLKAERDSPPPEEGYALDILLDDQNRRQTITIGQLDGDIKLRLNGIREDQLKFRFEKERELEEYTITVQPGANIFYRPPHARKLEPMKEAEHFESRELIGHPATVRVAASVQHNRPLQYAEFELSTGFVINKIGEEQMRFRLTLTRIFPGVDVSTRNKQGVYGFGRFKVADPDAEEAETA